ncbi:hypothetical protein M8J77_003581 [Diaphorina citri]|jgi:hypothetical protein|nr:hypothetical protein M8J77_003581 [Diaphorina citri]
MSRTLFILGDSHVRHLRNYIHHIDNTIDIIDHFQGGASLLQICNYLRETVSNEDHVFVFGGTNDIGRNSLSTLKPSLLKLLTEYPHGKFTFILVPLRVHWNRQCYQNSAIVNFNKEFEEFLGEQDRPINILDTNQLLHAGHYSPDGLHLNKAGKQAISDAIVSIFLYYS